MNKNNFTSLEKAYLISEIVSRYIILNCQKAVGFLWFLAKKLVFVFYSVVFFLLKKTLGWLWIGFVKSIDELRTYIIKFVIKIVLWALLIGFITVFAANSFSLSKTFSADGLETLIRAYK